MARTLRIALALAAALAVGWFGRGWLPSGGGPTPATLPVPASQPAPAATPATVEPGAAAESGLADRLPAEDEELPAQRPDGRPQRGGRVVHVVPIEDAVARHSRGAVVEFGATVSRLLADDRRGLQHQRFLVRLASGTTILVAHNTDLASRVPVQLGSAVEIRGRYIWNSRGGVVHWTHHDPEGRFAGGWIRLAGRTYQ